MRLNRIGFYKEIGQWKEAEVSSYSNAMQIMKYKEPIKFNFMYSNGEGMSKEEYNLFQNWLIQSGSAVIETSVNLNFNKGDKITINEEDNIIRRIIERIDKSRMNGNKQDYRKIKILFID